MGCIQKQSNSKIISNKLNKLNELDNIKKHNQDIAENNNTNIYEEKKTFKKLDNPKCLNNNTIHENIANRIDVINDNNSTVNNLTSKNIKTKIKFNYNNITIDNNLYINSNSEINIENNNNSNKELKTNIENNINNNNNSNVDKSKYPNNNKVNFKLLNRSNNQTNIPYEASNVDKGFVKRKTVREGKITEHVLDDFYIDRNFLVFENQKDPYEVYNPLDCLGEGSFGKVFKVEHKITKELRAMKVINKYSTTLSAEEEAEILKETELLKKLDHPNIIKIYEFYNTKRKLFIISELCTGGELFDRIIEVKYFTETVAAHIMKQIFSATAFCHSSEIIHRDLKPENILIENSEERKKDFFNIKIIDFGTGEINKHKMLSEKTGTAYYIAPEVIENCYNEKCDLWSCGVILYILLCGCPPFSAKSDDEIFEKIKIGKYKYTSKVWNEISDDAKDLIDKLLIKDYKVRLSAQQALNHKWFNNMFSDKNKKLLEYQKINFPKTHLQGIISSIKTFRAEKKLQQAALAFIVHNLAKRDDVKELRNVFLAFDLNGDGRLTKDELIQGMSQVMTKGEAINDVERIMNIIDVDKNGFIEYEEFLRASLNKEKLLSKENIKIAFDLFDQDGSGYISKLELKNVLGKGKMNEISDDVWTNIVMEIDNNSDGVISFEEFLEVMFNLVEKN